MTFFVFVTRHGPVIQQLQGVLCKSAMAMRVSL